MNRFTKATLIIGLILLVYGYLCRLLSIYFFWDSRNFGWIALFIALTNYLFNLRKTKKLQSKKTVWITFGIIFLSMGLIITPIVIFIFHKSEAYQSAIEYVKNDPKIKESIGEVKGFGLIPTGQVQSSSINGEESGVAIFNITVNGTKKYRDIIVTLKKTPETFWTATAIE